MRVIHVGLGSWGSSWATSVLAPADGVETVAWVDPDPVARQRVSETLGAPPRRFFGSLDEALVVEADAVIVASGIASHAAVTLTALRAGLPVLVEKPMAATLAEAATMVAEARRRGLVLSVSQNYRYFASMVAIRALSLGKVRRARVDFRRHHPGHGINPVEDDILTQISIHHFDLMRAVLRQEPLFVYCHAWHNEGIAPSDVAAVIEFDGGAVLSYGASRVSGGSPTPWEGDWQVECDRGEIVWASGKLSAGGVAVPIAENRQRDRSALLAAFVSAVREGTEPPSPGHDNIRSVALLDAARRSAAKGDRVAVDTTVS